VALTPIRTEPLFRRRYKKKLAAEERAVEDAVTQLRSDWRHPGLRTSAVQGKTGVFDARIRPDRSRIVVM